MLQDCGHIGLEKCDDCQNSSILTYYTQQTFTLLKSTIQKRYEMCSKLPIRSLERPYSIANFEQVNACWIGAVFDHVKEIPKVLVHFQKLE